MAAVSAWIRKTRFQMRNTVRVLRTQSVFKVVFVLCFAVGFETGLFLLFLDGFRFLDTLGGAGMLIVGRLFSLFFLGMSVMLMVSGAVTSYTTILRSPEIPFLIVHPFTVPQIVLGKFLESALLSSWAFFFIVVPFVGAFAVYRHVSLLFPLWTLAFSVPFLLISAGLGTAACLVMARWAPSGRILKPAGVLAAVVGLFFVFGGTREMFAAGPDTRFNLLQMVPGLRLASNPLLPSWWIAEGIMALSRGRWLRGALLFGVTGSTALMVALLIETLGRVTFYGAWQRLAAGRVETRPPARLNWIAACLRPLDRRVRALVVKDIRTFLRDPVQWSQALVFFGLLALYFANLRSFHYHTLSDAWRNTVAFLNVFSVSAVVCSLASRFIFPQMSLEGQGFWILGLSPAGEARILLTKFALSLAGTLSVSVLLMWLSSRMLEASPAVSAAAVGIVAAVSLAVSGLSTGLGAVFINLTERNPAAIVSGFGGTLNLVLCLSFLLVAIVPFAFLFHLRFTGRIAEGGYQAGLVLLGAGLAVLAVVAAAVPLWLGYRVLKRLEFAGVR